MDKKIEYFKKILTGFLATIFLLSCKKEESPLTPVPFLTDRVWTSDTITINPPSSYDKLAFSDQESYRQALIWSKNAKLTFHADGTVTSDAGDWDFGYKNWRLVNNRADIEVNSPNGKADTLRGWLADDFRFSYTVRFNNSFECRMVYK
jgi:hypothetical protein